MTTQTIFLTSSFIPYQRRQDYKPMPLIADNGFVERMRAVWKDHIRFLVFASDPDEDEGMRRYVERELTNAFGLSKLPIAEIKTFDHDAAEPLEDLLAWADIVYLAGGHAPTQNRFMQECDLRGKLQSFEGVILGLSAGAANSAEEVYLFPELPEESTDPSYVRTARGLGLTHMQIMPHGQYFSTLDRDGQSIFDGIIRPDSYGRCIYYIPDGSYFMIKDGITEFFGEGIVIKDGKVYPLHSGVVRSENMSSNYRLLQHLIPELYRLIFLIDVRDHSVRYPYVGEMFLGYHVDFGALLSYAKLMRAVTEFVVPEEQSAFLDQTAMEVVTEEIAHVDTYVRTIHMTTPQGRRATGLRIRQMEEDSPYLLGTLQDIEVVVDHDWMTDELARSGFIHTATNFLIKKTDTDDYSLVYTNIKGFKAINELFGQQSGDLVIFRERDVLRELLHPEIMGRLGSDHFAVICKNEYLTPENLAALALQIHTQDYKQFHYSIRLGIYPLTEEAVSIDDMLARAKLAEKTLADTGRVFYKRYDAELRSQYMDKNILLSDLNDSLESNQFAVFYQPVIDLKTSRICSAEALVRWNHPQLGMLSPNRFIPLFEQTGEITRLDYDMFHQVFCMEEARLRDHKRIVPVAVNLSRVDFYDPTFMQSILEGIASLGCSESPINIEVTESSYAVLENSATGYLEQMKQSGMKILLDDFGSGMSSMSTLESFDFDILKLDMGFVRKIGKSKKAEAIIESTIALAHALGAKVTAEGVEDAGQLAFLKRADCDMIQGYYYYKPMPLDEFEKLL